MGAVSEIVHGVDHGAGRLPVYPPIGGHQDDDAERSPGKDLLKAKIAVGGDQNIKALGLCGIQRFSVAQHTPASFESRRHILAGERVAQRNRNALGEQDLQGSSQRCFKTAAGIFQD
jgi:hypothetical protein